MYRTRRILVGSSPWETKTDADYLDACSRCEVRVIVVDVATRDELKRALVYDKKQERGGGGRILNMDMKIGAVTLLKGDRLEPCKTLPDVGALDTADAFPLNLIFWRKDKKSMVHHRNPIMNRELGVGMKAYAVDSLHALNLGVVQDYISFVVWEMVQQNSFNFRTASTMEARAQMTINRLYSQLILFYEKCAWPVTRINDLTIKMFGSATKPRCKLKAAEGEGMLHFVVDFLPSIAGGMRGGPQIRDAGESLLQLMGLLRSCDDMPTPSQVQEGTMTKS